MEERSSGGGGPGRRRGEGGRAKESFGGGGGEMYPPVPVLVIIPQKGQLPFSLKCTAHFKGKEYVRDSWVIIIIMPYIWYLSVPSSLQAARGRTCLRSPEMQPTVESNGAASTKDSSGGGGALLSLVGLPL